MCATLERTHPRSQRRAHVSRKPSTSRLLIGESLSLRFRIKELPLLCHRIEELSLRLWIEKPPLGSRRRAIGSGSHCCCGSGSKNCHCYAFGFGIDPSVARSEAAAAASRSRGTAVAVRT
jgi:hypothetical protein